MPFSCVPTSRRQVSRSAYSSTSTSHSYSKGSAASSSGPESFRHGVMASWRFPNAAPLPVGRRGELLGVGGDLVGAVQARPAHGVLGSRVDVVLHVARGRRAR